MAQQLLWLIYAKFMVIGVLVKVLTEKMTYMMILEADEGHFKFGLF